MAQVLELTVQIDTEEGTFRAVGPTGQETDVAAIGDPDPVEVTFAGGVVVKVVTEPAEFVDEGEGDGEDDEEDDGDDDEGDDEEDDGDDAPNAPISAQGGNR